MSDENTTVYSMDPDNPPPLTAEQKEMFARLKALPDSEIDYSDIPKHDFTRYPMTRSLPARGKNGQERTPRALTESANA